MNKVKNLMHRMSRMGTMGRMGTMSARQLLRGLLALQAAAVALVATALRVGPGWHWGTALAAAVATLLLVRLAISTNNFVLSASSAGASATPAPARLTLAGWLRLCGAEFVASMLQTSWYGPRGLPCQRVFDAAAATRLPVSLPVLLPAPVPVLLLHGYGGNSGFWTPLMARLRTARISHASVDLEPLTASIDDYADHIEHAVDALCAATGAAGVVIVAHSMGGLAARAWLRRYGSSRLLRLITLGTPHHGTTLANLGVGLNAAQMRRSRAGLQSAWLAQLDADEAASGAGTRALITSIYSYQDNIVSPQNSSCLAGARLLPLAGVGHVALGSDARALDGVLAELAAVQAAASAHQHGQGRALAGKLMS
ncbi:esterase/lipase family protein [Massilia sp. PWRC2]|uniref:esterase/lipase family protein n=1 Tax=Massilia sp. PWRC2 TaxID=2804626 RepID=UPI003CF1D884